jgi:transcription elongation factor
VNGPYKGKKGVIRNIFKNFVFLYNQDFISTNGIFVDKSENLEIMGSELLSDNMYHGKVNIRKPPEPLRKSVGTLVRIVHGNWKGYIGILKKVTDKNALVELTSKNKTITIDISFIQTIDDEGQAKGNMDFMNTPRSNYAGINTPAYYPQSPSYGATMSPGWNPVSTRKFFNKN